MIPGEARVDGPRAFMRLINLMKCALRVISQRGVHHNFVIVMLFLLFLVSTQLPGNKTATKQTWSYFSSLGFGGYNHKVMFSVISFNTRSIVKRKQKRWGPLVSKKIAKIAVREFTHTVQLSHVPGGHMFFKPIIYKF